MINKIKVRIADFLTHPLIGRGIGRLLGNSIPHGNVRLDLSSAAVADRTRACIYWGLYESAERRFIQKYLYDSVDVVELGSSIGANSSIAAGRLKQGTRLVCVEANATLLETLHGNLGLNAKHLEVSVVNAAICYSGPSIQFAVHPDGISSAVNHSHDRSTTVEVPATTLSSIIAEHVESQYQLISDIEGAEVEILELDRSAFASCKQIIIELHTATFRDKEYSIEDLIAKFVSLGYRQIDRHGPVVVFRK